MCYGLLRLRKKFFGIIVKDVCVCVCGISGLIECQQRGGGLKQQVMHYDSHLCHIGFVLFARMRVSILRF